MRLCNGGRSVWCFVFGVLFLQFKEVVMSMMSRFSVTAALGTSMLLAAAQLTAQQPAPPRVQPAQPGQPRQPAQPGQRPQPGQGGQRADAQLAACLIVDNQGEVAAAKIAQQRADNAQVKRFAEQMVEDHGEFINKLQRFTGGARPAARPGAGQEGQPQRGRQEQAQPNRQDQAQREGTARPADTARPPAERTAREEQRSIQQPGGAMRGGLDFVSLKQELGRQCLESTRKELESKEGKEFDRCFMGMQIMKHMVALDTMKVFKNHASPELGQTLDEGIRTAQTHLEHAKEIARQLEGDAASTARRPEK
jgi:putative membrane protein